ncbi:hypothetical protein V5O48_013082 [Marasmius crinis-equi]|uniref:Uncharacterized protein n=1 Tax=Marasmius crinis-equi TaxID=585013 RepID=A0ABR3F121_9AGAR
MKPRLRPIDPHLVNELVSCNEVDHPSSGHSALEEARLKMVEAGFLRSLLWEQKIAWADHDCYQ